MFCRKRDVGRVFMHVFADYSHGGSCVVYGNAFFVREGDGSCKSNPMEAKLFLYGTTGAGEEAGTSLKSNPIEKIRLFMGLLGPRNLPKKLIKIFPRRRLYSPWE